MKRISWRATRLLLALTAATLGAGAPAAWAGPANGGLPGAPASNPLAGLPWGNYTGPQDEVFGPYSRSSGETHRLLGLIALRPRMRWFGRWYADDQIQQTVQDYLQYVTGGDSRVMAQMAVFRLYPWEGEARRRLPSGAEQSSYRRWIDAFARGVGDARVALVLQPDLPFELCVPHHSGLPMRLVAYAARVFSALPHTTVYIDVGASDWTNVGSAVSLLRGAGVAYTRGFALGATHYAPTADEIAYGAKVSAGLASHGIRGKHFVINTAQNGRGFTYQQYRQHSTFDNATVCRSRTARRCVTLGIPPTSAVADPRWGLSRSARATARRLVDGYMWIGRPWLYNQSDPFDLNRSLQLARTWPYS